MIEEIDFETYLYISNERFIVSVFEKKNSQNLYKKEFEFKNHLNNINFDYLSEFLDQNIFKIEKLIGQFIKNIFLVIETIENLKIDICIKKNNYGELIHQKNIQYALNDVRDQFKKNYQNTVIMHMMINDYLIDGKNYSSLVRDLRCNNFCLEISFIYISKYFVSKLDKILKKYQIQISQNICGNYVRTFIKNDNYDICAMAFKIRNGSNENEILLVPKNHKNMGFFEKFFQLFS